MRERERGETEAASRRGSWKRERERLSLQAGRKMCLPQRIGEGKGVACLLKRQDNHYSVQHGLGETLFQTTTIVKARFPHFSAFSLRRNECYI